MKTNTTTDNTNTEITVKCKCGKVFVPSYGEYTRCPKCLGNQLEAAEHACGVE